MEDDHRSNDRTSDGKSGHKRMREEDVEFDPPRTDDNPAEKKKRTSEETSEPFDLKNDNRDNPHFSEEKSQQKRNKGKGEVRPDVPRENENPIEMKKMSNGNLNDNLVDTSHPLPLLGNVVTKIQTSNYTFSSFNDSIHEDWTTESHEYNGDECVYSSSHHDAYTNNLSSEEKVHNPEAEKQKTEFKREAKDLRSQESKKIMQELKQETQELEQSSQELRQSSQELQQTSQKLLQSSQNLLQSSQNILQYSQELEETSQELEQRSQDRKKEAKNLKREARKLKHELQQDAQNLRSSADNEYQPDEWSENDEDDFDWLSDTDEDESDRWSESDEDESD